MFLRPLLAAMVAIAAGTSISTAAELRDFAGKWVGTRTEVVNGRVVTLQQTTEFRTTREGGLKGYTVIKFPGVGVITARGSYGADGSYEAVTYARRQVVGVSVGSWKLRNSTLTTRGTTRDLSGVYRATATTQLVGRYRLALVSTLSNGTRIAITLRRR